MLLLPVLVFSLLVIALLIGLVIRSRQSYQKLASDFKNRESQISRKLYETAVLEEVGQRIGYSLNVEKIAEIITGSLSNLVPYSTASYITILPDRLIFGANLREGVSEKFVTDVKKRMLASVMALTAEDLSKRNLDEGTSGVLTSETNQNPVRSFFNIPLVINDKITGLINVASTNEGLYQEADMTVLYKIAERASTAVSRLESVLESEKGKLAVMVESLADGLMMVDSSLQLLVTNPSSKSLLGLPTDKEAVFFDVQEALEHYVEIRSKIEESLKSGKVVEAGEFAINEKFVRILVAPVKNSQGVLGVVVIINDRTQEKTLERLREDFTAMMVHELRTPLSVMFGTSDLLIKRYSQLSVEKTSALLFNIKDSSKSMLEIVNDLLDAAKIESGKFTVNAVPGDIVELLAEEATYFDGLVRSKGLELLVKTADNLPKVLFDKSRVLQIVNNLISNALKFTEKGTITLEAKLSLDKNRMQISVGDTGVGIPKDSQAKLFNKFEQLRNPVDPKSKGTGLGLVIAKGIVEAHGGTIWLESLEGKGTTFYFTLPLAVG